MASAPPGPGPAQSAPQLVAIAHPTMFVKHGCVYAVMCAIFVCLAWSAFGVALSASQVSRSFLGLAGYLVLAMASGGAACMAFSHARYCWVQRHMPARPAQVANPALFFLALVLPTILLLIRFNPLPTSDETKGNCIITFAFLMRLGALLDLPTKHLMLQFVLTYPLLTFLDFHRRCHQPAAFPDLCVYFSGANFSNPAESRVDCCSPGSFGQHLISRGLSMLLLGLVASSVPVIMAIKQQRAASPQPELVLPPNDDSPVRGHAQSQQRGHAPPNLDGMIQAAAWLPFDPFDVAMDWMGPLLCKVDIWLGVIADQVDEVVLVAVVCVPFALYYASFALVSRIMPKYASTSDVTADEWLLVLSIFFVLGKESCMVDTLPLLTKVRGQLSRAHVILADILPSHVLDIMLERKSAEEEEQEEEEEENSDLKRPVDPRRSGDGIQPSDSASGTVGSQLLAAANGSVGSSAFSEHRPHAIPGSRKFKMAESHECVSIFFSEICDFAHWTRLLPAAKVMQTLNDLYSRLDDIILNEFPGLYKVETIGDAYLVAANLIISDEQHAATMVRYALRAQEEAGKVPVPGLDDGATLQLRIGIHSGPTVSGFVGKVRRHFCLFGNTINMAARTETSCPPGCIQITEATYQLALPHLNGELHFQDRGEVVVKGATKPLHMYLVVSLELRYLSRSLQAAESGALLHDEVLTIDGRSSMVAWHDKSVDLTEDGSTRHTDGGASNANSSLSSRSLPEPQAGVSSQELRQPSSRRRAERADSAMEQHVRSYVEGTIMTG